MIVRPAINYKYHPEVIFGEAVFFFSETERHVLEAPHYLQIISLVDGSHTTEEIAHLLSASIPKETVYETIRQLSDDGFVCEANAGMPVQQSAFWSSMGVDTLKLYPHLNQGTVGVIALDKIDPKPMLQVLSTFGFKLADAADVFIVLVNDYQSEALAAINQDFLTRRIPFLLVKPMGVNIWIGPVVIPGKTPCWKCLEDRLRHNREIESFVQRRLGRKSPLPVSKAQVYPIEYQAYYLAGIQLARLITSGTNPTLEGQINIFDSISFQLNRHLITKRPQCPACGSIQPDPNLRFQSLLKDNLEGVPSENGYRTQTPEDTFARFAHHISPITGIVSAIAPSQGLANSPIRLYHAGHNFAFKNDTLYFLKDGLRSGSAGKGKSEAQARTSALCEALERYSGVYSGEETRIQAKFSDLGFHAIHPNACMLYSEKQYANREQWLNRGRFNAVPLRFQEEELIEWSPVYSFSRKVIKYLPTAYLYFGYPLPDNHIFCWADSNGNAAGSSLEDACLQGLLEIVERDSVSFWWYNMLQRPGVDITSFQEPYYDELKSFYKAHDREFWVLDITADSGIPVFVAVSRRIGGPTEDILMGFGAHPDAKVALMRAVTEMNQFTPSVLNIKANGETNYLIEDKETVHWWKTATIQNQSYMKPLEGAVKTSLSDYYMKKNNFSISSCLQECISRIEEIGLEVLLLNQTRADVGLDVVKVIIPGMRHFWARYAPGRLYDVPVKMGWLNKVKTEEELNPIPLFL